MLPAIDHVQQRAGPVVRTLADADRAGKRPRPQPERSQCQAHAGIVQRERFLADARTATPAELVRETGTPAGLAPGDLEAQPGLTRLAVERTPRVAFGAKRAVGLCTRLQVCRFQWLDDGTQRTFILDQAQAVHGGGLPEAPVARGGQVLHQARLE